MKFLILKTTDPYVNLATEEYFFNETRDDVFMLWQNEPTVVIGKNQNAYAEINSDYVTKNGIHVARRITGGGAVYHDLGNINYTFISGNMKERALDFEFFTSPIIEVLATLGIEAQLSGRNDILVGNKKISGNAQHSNHGRVLHHGTLLFDTDINVLSLALKVDREKIATKAIKSVSSRVTNLKPLLTGSPSATDLINSFSEFIIKKYSPEIVSAPSLKDIETYYTRLSSSDWIFPAREMLTDYTVSNKRRFKFGSMEIKIKISGDKITDVKICGDYFGISDTAELEAKLRGGNYTALENSISKINISDYVYGMTNEDFINLLKEKAE